jgi:hypothetical protein
MDRNFYRFHSTWPVDATPRETYEALERFEDYSAWWPEVRAFRMLGPESCEVTCRSLLPYDLTFVLRPARRDPEAMILEASMVGDLEGFSRWTITATPSGAQLTFDEEVTVRKRSLRLLAPVARPLYRANHSIMMRHARTGLSSYLARTPRPRPGCFRRRRVDVATAPP